MTCWQNGVVILREGDIEALQPADNAFVIAKTNGTRLRLLMGKDHGGSLCLMRPSGV